MLFPAQLPVHNSVHIPRPFVSKEISMLKKCLLVVLAAGLIAMAIPFAAAQSSDNQSAPPPAQNQDQANGGHHHGPPDPAQRTQELTKKLKLTSDQQTKVQGLLETEHTQMESLHQDSSLSQ